LDAVLHAWAQYDKDMVLWSVEKERGATEVTDFNDVTVLK